jgi:hypothetical protein
LGNFQGIEQFRTRLQQLPEELLDKAGKGLYQEALIMQAVSMERTPVRDGILRGTHETSEPERDGNVVRVTISVGGSAAPYAYFVHEDLETNHNLEHRDPRSGKVYTCGGQPKFLESSVREGSEGLGGRLADRMK